MPTARKAQFPHETAVYWLVVETRTILPQVNHYHLVERITCGAAALVLLIVESAMTERPLDKSEGF